MKARKFTVDTWIGDGIDARVTFNYYPGSPGNTSGPPERCYEPEPDEVEILSVIVNGAEVALTEAQEEVLHRRIYEDAGGMYSDAREVEAEAYAEIRRSFLELGGKA